MSPYEYNSILVHAWNWMIGLPATLEWFFSPKEIWEPVELVDGGETEEAPYNKKIVLCQCHKTDQSQNWVLIFFVCTKQMEDLHTWGANRWIGWNATKLRQLES